MANPYTSVTISGYNSSPPADDNSEVASNAVEWDKHIEKIGDPIKTGVEAVNTNISSAFGKRWLNATTTLATNYNLQLTDEGKLFVTSTAMTINLLAAATATAGFSFAVRNSDASLNLTIDGATSEVINGAVTVTVGPGDWAIISCDGSAWNALIFEDINTQNPIEGDKSHWPVVSNAADTDHDITVSTGQIVDTTKAYILNLTSAITKQVDASWVAGTDVGGFPSGLTITADTTYHFFIIYDVTNDLYDAGFDTSLTATNLLADATDYTIYRRIGSLILDGSNNFIPFTQIGDKFEYTTPISDIDTTTIGSVDGTVVLTVPASVPGLQAKIKCAGTAIDGIRAMGQNALHNKTVQAAYASFLTAGDEHDILVENANHEIQIDNNATSDDLRIDILSYTDPRLG